MSRFELLAPAGDMERLETALRFGADAVYLGGPKLQLRAASAGFDMETLARAVHYAHERGRRVYVTVNAFANNAEAAEIDAYAGALAELGVDAVIVADLGLIAQIHKTHPRLAIHVSTQANCTNYLAARTYWELGARRVVLARELTLEEIAGLRRLTPPELELEAFVHGAMCMAYSGRCLISAHLTGRSANRGGCAQSCRWSYQLLEEKRPGEYFPIEEDETGTTILSSRDLNALPFLDQLMEAGVTSFKIEGRMKTAYYVATVVNAYRRRLDQILSGAAEPTVAELERELDAASHRAWSSGFYFGELRDAPPDSGIYLQDCVFAGVVERMDGPRAVFSLRNRIRADEVIEVLTPGAASFALPARDLRDENGGAVEIAQVPGRVYSFLPDRPLRPGDILRLRADGCRRG